jgi:hypothetical protein
MKTLIWIPTALNLIVWAGLIGGVIIMIWGLYPKYGGWRSLDWTGRVITIAGTICFAACAVALLCTTTIPV